MPDLPKQITELFDPANTSSFDKLVLRLEEIDDELKANNDREAAQIEVFNTKNKALRERIKQALDKRHEEGLTMVQALGLLTELLDAHSKMSAYLNASHSLQTITAYQRKRANHKLIDQIKGK